MKNYYSYDANTFIYTGSGKCQISPRDGEFLIPANATSIKIPDNIPENKVPKFDKSKKKWVLVSDPKYVKFLDARNKADEIKAQKELQDALSKVDEFGAKINKRVGDGYEPKTPEELSESRKKATKEALRFDYRAKLDEVILQATECFLFDDPQSYKEALKNYYQQVNIIWNNIDGTIPWDEITWPEIPRI